MYRLSTNRRKYSTSPIVKVLEDGTEVPILIALGLPKAEGDELAEKIIKLLNGSKKMTIKYKKESLKELKHEDIYIDEVYIGYIIKDDPLVGAVKEWHFTPSRDNNFLPLASETRKDLLKELNNITNS